MALLLIHVGEMALPGCGRDARAPASSEPDAAGATLSTGTVGPAEGELWRVAGC